MHPRAYTVEETLSQRLRGWRTFPFPLVMQRIFDSRPSRKKVTLEGTFEEDLCFLKKPGLDGDWESHESGRFCGCTDVVPDTGQLDPGRIKTVPNYGDGERRNEAHKQTDKADREKRAERKAERTHTNLMSASTVLARCWPRRPDSVAPIWLDPVHYILSRLNTQLNTDG